MNDNVVVGDDAADHQHLYDQSSVVERNNNNSARPEDASANQQYMAPIADEMVGSTQKIFLMNFFRS